MADDRTIAIRACRDLEKRCIRIGHSIGQEWAHGWANVLLDTRVPGSIYNHWIADLTGFVERKEAVLAQRVAA